MVEHARGEQPLRPARRRAGRAGRAAAARPDPRPGARRSGPARARSSGRAQIADAIVRRINGGTPLAAAFAEAQPRLPAPESVEMRRLDISRGGQQVPAAAAHPVQRSAGPRPGRSPAPNGAGWFVVFHAQRTPGDAATEPQLIQHDPDRVHTAPRARRSPSNSPARSSCRSEITRNEEAIRRARGCGRRRGGVSRCADDPGRRQL